MEPVVHGNQVATACTMDGENPDSRLGQIGVMLISLLSLGSSLHPALHRLSHLLLELSKPVRGRSKDDGRGEALAPAGPELCSSHIISAQGHGG